MATLDAHLVALEMKTGKVVFDVEMEKPERGFAVPAPLSSSTTKLIVGIAEAKYANRGFSRRLRSDVGEPPLAVVCDPEAGVRRAARRGRPISRARRRTDAG